MSVDVDQDLYIVYLCVYMLIMLSHIKIILHKDSMYRVTCSNGCRSYKIMLKTAAGRIYTLYMFYYIIIVCLSL